MSDICVLLFMQRGPGRRAQNGADLGAGRDLDRPRTSGEGSALGGGAPNKRFRGGIRKAGIENIWPAWRLNEYPARSFGRGAVADLNQSPFCLRLRDQIGDVATFLVVEAVG